MKAEAKIIVYKVLVYCPYRMHIGGQLFKARNDKEAVKIAQNIIAKEYPNAGRYDVYDISKPGEYITRQEIELHEWPGKPNVWEETRLNDETGRREVIRRELRYK